MASRGRWVAERHTPEENERRALARFRLKQVDARLFEAMEIARHGDVLSAELVAACKERRKRVSETQRRGPKAIEALVGSLEGLRARVLEVIAASGPQPAPASNAADDEALAAALDGIPYGAVVRSRRGLGWDRARLRAKIAGTYLTSDRSSASVAREYRALFREALAGEKIAVEIVDIPPSLYVEFLSVSEASVRRWADKLRKALAESQGGMVPADVEVLRHRQPASQVAARTKRDLALKDATRELLLEDGELSCVELAGTVGRDVSPRTMRRHLQEDFEPAEVVKLRGGVLAADEVLWSRIGRRPARSNAIWVMDDAQVRHDFIDPKYAGKFTDLPIDFEYELLVPAPGGVLVAQRADRLYTQTVLDAHSRKHLCTRLFPHPPDAMETLTTMARAMLRFGVPGAIFTDNGGNYRSGLVGERLAEAGVRKVFSRPRDPRANGAAENFVAFLKKVLGKQPGGYRKPGGWAVGKLLFLPDLEALAEDRIETEKNRKVHRLLGMTPNECYVRGSGGIGLTDPRRILRLLHVEEGIRREADHIHIGNARYYGGCLVMVPKGTLVDVYFDPMDPLHRWVMRPMPGGEDRFIGPVRYVGDLDVPDRAERREEEAAFLERQIGPTMERVRQRQEIVRRERARVQGERKGERDVARLAELLADVQAGRPASLPPATEAKLDPRYRRLW